MTTTTKTTTDTAKRATINWPAAIWILSLHVGALAGAESGVLLVERLAVCLFLHWLSGGIGICMTYHRLLTHRSFATRPKALEYVLTAIGCTASEGGPIGWVADHRKHHAHSDEEEDVHSPRRGFGWAHMFWWMTPDITAIHTPEYYKRWAPDLNRDPVLRFLDRFHIVFPIALGIGPVRHRRNALAGLGWLRQDGSCAAHDLAGQLGHPCLGIPYVSRPVTIRRTSGGWHWSRMARVGTTTITPSRPRPVTATPGTRST